MTGASRRWLRRRMKRPRCGRSKQRQRRQNELECLFRRVEGTRRCSGHRDRAEIPRTRCQYGIDGRRPRKYGIGRVVGSVEFDQHGGGTSGGRNEQSDDRGKNASAKSTSIGLQETPSDKERNPKVKE